MEASFVAASVPLQSAEMCFETMKLALRMAEIGNVNAISDAASGLYQAKAGLEAACLNVCINLLGYETEARVITLVEKAGQLRKSAEELVAKLQVVLKKRAGL
jgi:glutamate formiminotransferase/formiminotetrahydrofolate cyclodeaminase